MRLERFGEVVSLLGCPQVAVTEQGGGQPDVNRIVDGHSCRGGVSKQVGVDRAAEGFPGAFDDAIIYAHLRKRRAIGQTHRRSPAG